MPLEGQTRAAPAVPLVLVAGSEQFTFYHTGRWWVRGRLVVAMGHTHAYGAEAVSVGGPHEPSWVPEASDSAGEVDKWGLLVRIRCNHFFVENCHASSDRTSWLLDADYRTLAPPPWGKLEACAASGASL